MHDDIQQDALVARLTHELRTLEEEDALGYEEQATVALDQQSVGRLSRMDAMQRQAMAQATARRRTLRKRQILAALSRAEDGELGYCVDCGDAISAARLGFDAAAHLCVSCAKG